jgi:hypothetical protein
MPGVTTLTRVNEVSLRELARGVLTPTRPRPELEVDIEFVHETTFDDGFPQIEIIAEQPILVDPGEFATTLRFSRQDASVSWFDKPEDVIALVGDPEPIASPWSSLRIPLALIGFGAVAAVTLAWLLG